MNQSYIENATYFKVLSDPNRLMILDMLSCEELCACDILEKFDITQPTLSHHMKILCDCGLTTCRKAGKWTHYAINQEKVNELKLFLNQITSPTEECICDRKAVAFNE